MFESLFVLSIFVFLIIYWIIFIDLIIFKYKLRKKYNTLYKYKSITLDKIILYICNLGMVALTIFFASYLSKAIIFYEGL